jgi:hypothetical protein
MKEYLAIPLSRFYVCQSPTSVDETKTSSNIEEFLNQQASQGWELKQFLRWGSTWMILERDR